MNSLATTRIEASFRNAYADRTPAALYLRPTQIVDLFANGDLGAIPAMKMGYPIGSLGIWMGYPTGIPRDQRTDP